MLKHGKRKDLITAEKLKIGLLSEEMSTFEISKKICRDHQTIKKAVKDITMLRIWGKEKGFKNLFPLEEHQKKWVIAKQPILTSTHIYENTGIGGVKKVKGVEHFVNWDLKKNNLCNVLLQKQIS